MTDDPDPTIGPLIKLLQTIVDDQLRIQERLSKLEEDVYLTRRPRIGHNVKFDLKSAVNLH